MTLARADSGVVTNTKAASKQSPPCEKGEMPAVHPLVNEVTRYVDDFALENWDFPDYEAKQDFVERNVSGVASYYFPSALDDRIFLVSKLLAVLFLLAGMILRQKGGLGLIADTTTETLLEFDIEDAEEYIEALEAAVKGHWLPDESIPAVWMLCSVFDEIRAQDYLLADDITETIFAHLR